MRLKEMQLTEAATVLIAVADGVLADSMRFSLELEGFAVKLCDEYSLPRAIASHAAEGCLVLDQEVFGRIAGKGREVALGGIPAVLMVGLKSEQVLARAKAAGVSEVIETPLMGEVLSDAIKAALDAREPSRAQPRRH